MLTALLATVAVFLAPLVMAAAVSAVTKVRLRGFEEWFFGYVFSATILGLFGMVFAAVYFGLIATNYINGSSPAPVQVEQSE